ncbi:aldo/keto reductase [Streptomyces sp. NPDC001220]
MQYRTLGSQGLEVSAIGYGAMGLTMACGPTDEEAGVAALRRAHDLGVTFSDTAEMYGWVWAGTRTEGALGPTDGPTTGGFGARLGATPLTVG